MRWLKAGNVAGGSNAFTMESAAQPVISPAEEQAVSGSGTRVPASRVLRLLMWAMAGGGVVAALFALQAPKTFGSVFGTLLAVAGAASVCGALLGFVFGIPRALQGGGSAGSEAAGHAAARGSESRYGANTSLEQISDWLTKILVGVGLTQLTELPGALESYSQFVGQSLPGVSGGHVFVGAETLYFAICGFLASYLWTRLELGKALSEVEMVTRAEFEQEKQANALALQLVEQQLRKGVAAPVEAELAQAIAAADDLYRSHVFGRARSTRKVADAKRDVETIQRTIPIFRALIARSPEGYHQNYGQLGFALAALNPPDLAAAEAQLTKAIELRGDSWARYGYEFYEVVRALCRIRRAQGQGENKPAPQDRDAVLRDLAALAHARFTNLEDATQQELHRWVTENGVLDQLDADTREAMARLTKR